MLSAIAASAGHTVPVALRINPDIDAGTHAKITTGRADNKFGVGLDTAAALFAQAAELPGIRAVGLALHIGSQISAMAPYRAAFARVAGLVQALRAGGHTVTRLDCGGGLGIRYRDEVEGSPAALAGAMQLAFEGLALELMVEPGRWLAGPSGLLLTGVVLTKTTGSRHFTVLDAAMNDLVRPAMYDSWHGMVPVSAADALGARGVDRHRRPGLRNRGHLRATTYASGTRPQRGCGDPRHRCLWFRHELHLQRPALGGPGDG